MSVLLHATRSLRRAPFLAGAAVLCIGIGAAATTTVATLVSATLLRPVPFPAADRLVRIWFEEPGAHARISLSIPEVGEFARMKTFDAFAGTARVRVTARLAQGSERMRGEGISRGYFEMLGLRPAAGRLLVASDHEPDAPNAVVLSHATWMRHFGGDAGVIGREFKTARAIYIIVGVAEQGFEGTVEDDIVEFFVPIEQYEPHTMRTSRTARPSWVIGRLAPHASIDLAQQEAERLRHALAQTYPDVYRSWRVRVEAFGESWRERLRSGGALLFGAAALLLMIAAVNVGCLLLARVLDRRRELAVRAALGADRRCLVVQLFTEAVVLVMAGGALGALLGPWLLDAFLAMAPLGRLALPRYLQLAPDAITLALALATLGIGGVLAGTVPAIVGGRVMPGDVLRDGGRGTIGHGVERRWGAVLIAGETALTLVVLVAGLLLVRSYERLSTFDIGFERARIARLAVTLSQSDFGDRSRLPEVYARLRRELTAEPGVIGVGLVSPTLPPWDAYRSRVQLEGVTLPHAPNGVQAGTHMADEGLLPMLGATILAGRNLDRRDDRSGQAVAVISRSLAALIGGPERALGRTVTFREGDTGMPDGPFRVVGVAEDVAYDGLVDETRRFVRYGAAGAPVARYDVYVPLAQFPATVVSIGASTAMDPASLIEPLRRRIAGIAPGSAVHWTGTMDDEVAMEYEPARFYTVLVVAFSTSALALTSVGLFALMSHAAARRTGEMGLRLALGASRASAARLLLTDGLVPLAAGLGGGIVAAALVARAMNALLYGIGSFDLTAFAAAIVALLMVALAAGLMPARRVASVDPIIALRS